ncbi:MAG TPA: quercetin 2,3-dioxygenase [Actinomycetota bacterium]|nr:quercetin 2,3-dioxygenase [Actinomycetota bacterium]
MTTAFLVDAERGQALWSINTLTRVLAGADSTEGAMGVWEWRGTSAGNPPLHVHHREDEAFYLLEGRITFEVGEERLHASAGDFVFAPRDLPHRFAVESAEARMLVLVTPGGFERFFAAVGRPAESSGLPPLERPDPEALARAAAPYGVDILGPPIG